MAGSIVSLAQACAIIAEGGVVAYPTETFYAVGCDAACADAVKRIYAIKKRDQDKPLPVLAASAAMLADLCDLTRVGAGLRVFWPGPLTLLVPASSPPLAPRLVSDRGLCAVRVTPHPQARALSQGSGAALTASSANLQGGSPAVRPEEIDPAVCNAVDGILAAEELPGGGLPSTIAEPGENGVLTIFRNGAVSGETLERAGFAVRFPSEK